MKIEEFKPTINWNEYKSKVITHTQSQYLDYLIDPSFQGVNRLFVLLLADNAHQTSYTGYFLPTAEIKHYNVMIDRMFFWSNSKKCSKKKL